MKQHDIVEWRRLGLEFEKEWIVLAGTVMPDAIPDTGRNGLE